MHMDTHTYIDPIKIRYKSGSELSTIVQNQIQGLGPQQGARSYALVHQSHLLQVCAIEIWMTTLVKIS
jgi:hypothetical protein